jgi:hypothetical protein
MLPTIENEAGAKVKESTLHWTLSGKRLNGTDVIKSGDITNVKPATEYILTVKYNSADQEELGGGSFTIEVKEEPLSTVNQEYTITMGPRIEGYDSYEDLSQPVYASTGEVGKKSIFASVSGTSFKSFSISSSILSKIIPSSSVNLVGLSDANVQKLAAGGVTFTQYSNEENNYAWIKLTFSADLLNGLEAGDYPVRVSVTDQSDRTSTATLDIYITDAAIVTNTVSAGDVWSRHAVVTASISNQDKIDVAGIKYRKTGTQTWTDATVSVSGTTVKATLANLEPETEYEYVACNGAAINNDTQTFTTSNVNQLPNAGFEEGYKDGNIERFNNEGDDLFWDSGNTGSSTLKKNVTVRSTDKKAKGDYSLKLASQWVGMLGIGEFAAGNVFVGQYLDTDGTDGILGWGRAWTSRPAKLKGYLHYTPGTVEYTKISSVSKGDQDTGIIYIALLDNSISKTYNGSSWPVIIKTATKELFSKDDSNVIAYGEKVLTSATSGDAMVEFEIELDYKKTTVIPSYIILTCSASRYGDYFTGGSSVLYVDGLQLVYE